MQDFNGRKILMDARLPSMQVFDRPFACLSGSGEVPPLFRGLEKQRVAVFKCLEMDLEQFLLKL